MSTRLTQIYSLCRDDVSCFITQTLDREFRYLFHKDYCELERRRSVVVVARVFSNANLQDCIVRFGRGHDHGLSVVEILLF